MLMMREDLMLLGHCASMTALQQFVFPEAPPKWFPVRAHHGVYMEGVSSTTSVWGPQASCWKWRGERGVAQWAQRCWCWKGC